MKVFNGKEAAEQYMSSHTLTFSTPDLTLKRFSFWLGDIVPDPNNKEETMPRLMNYIEEKDFAPAQVIDDEKYEPSFIFKLFPDTLKYSSVELGNAYSGSPAMIPSGMPSALGQSTSVINSYPEPVQPNR